MANPNGNELVGVIGVTSYGGLSGVSEFFTTQQIANLGGGGGSGTGGQTSSLIVSTGLSDTFGSTDVLVAWNSAAASAKAETIPAPTSLGRTITVKDEYGNAATYNITLTPVSGTIDGVAKFVMSANKQSVTLVADGTSNWMVV